MGKGGFDLLLIFSGFMVEGGGGGGGATNLTTTQTISNFTINSNTGTDATVPLGNGTLAGATLNDYTTAEKNKLSGIATGAEVNVNADWNATSGDAQILNKPTISGTNTWDQNLQSVTNLGASTTTSITANSFVKSGGTSSEILAADGSVITAGNNITITGGTISSVGGTGGGGSSVNYYLNGGTSQGTFGGTTYYEFSKTAVIGTGADFSRGTNGYIASFITDVADPSLLLIPAGNWNLEFFFNSSSAGGSPSFYVELYKYDGTTFTSIASSSATPEQITNGTSIDAYFTPLAVPETILTVNDRLAIRVFVNASSKTITLHTQNGHLCEVITTFTSGLTALNGLQAQVQNFATGTTGTDFAINSSGSTHTFNLPSASATARGVVTTGGQTFAGTKTFSNSIVANSDAQAGIKINTFEANGNPALIIDYTNTDPVTARVLTISDIGGIQCSGLTLPNAAFANTIAGFNINKDLIGLPTATYPSLTELTYVKGVTSAIQTQINAKANDASVVHLTGNETIAGVKTFSSNPKIPATGSELILSVSSGGTVNGLTTSIYASPFELTYLKGVTSAIQTQLNEKQATLSSTVNIKSINGNSILGSGNLTIGTASQSAYTVLANNTNASAVPTEQVYKDVAQQTYTATPTWSGSSPTTILANTYEWSQIGSLVTVRISLSYNTGASSTSVILPMPADMPVPASITGFTGNSDILSYGSGMMLISTTSTAVTGARNCLLRRNTSGGYEFFVNVSVGVTVKVVIVNLTYFA